MITIEKSLELKDVYPLSRIGEPSGILFFDIETTGLSGDYSSLYLIGCVFFRDGNWRLIQWFADRPDAEEEMLRAFFSLLKDFKILLHFNGDGFDIPYVLKRCAAHGLDFDFSQVESVDIYKKIKPFKRLLGLENLKQKTIERFLGIERQDLFTGGQLIEVYREYLASGDPKLYRLLILHNEDDLKGMPSILPILSYPDFLSLPLAPEGWSIESASGGGETKRLLLCYRSEACLPVPIKAAQDPFSLEASDSSLRLFISLSEGEMKRFYPNYKDYYYLIYEDTAVHKSVGEYVERTARKRATAKTCYTKAQGLFLPQPSPVFESFLKREYGDKTTYLPCTKELCELLAGKKEGPFSPRCDVSQPEPSGSPESSSAPPAPCGGSLYLQSVLSLFL